MTVDPNDWPEAVMYFEHYSDGIYDPTAFLDWIYKVGDVRESDDGDELYIGRPGVDGIEFVYRRGSGAIWAYHPMESRWQLLADDIKKFERGWKAGELRV